MHPRHFAGQATSSDSGGFTPAGVSDFLGSVPGPVQTGQQLGQYAQDAIGSLSSGLSGLSSSLSQAANASDAAQSAYQSQMQAAADLLKQQQLQASGTAKGSASNLGAIVLIAAGAIVIALFLTRKS
jgi:hypothetical protein